MATNGARPGGAFPLLRTAGWGKLALHRWLVTRVEGRAFTQAALGQVLIAESAMALIEELT
jgi:hypothetical protein